MTHTDDDIPADLKAVFDEAARETIDAGASSIDAPPAGLKAAMWDRIEAQIANAPVTAPAVPASAGAVRIAAMAGFGAGLLSGIAGTMLAVQTLVAPVEVVAPEPVETVETPVSLAEADPTPSPIAPVSPVKTRALVVVAPTPPPTTVEPEGEYSTERAWLDAAYRALERGEIDEAMDALEVARTRYPAGKLTEEREAIGVHVLISRGDPDSARLAVETFRKRHPASTFLSKIEERFREMEESP